MDQFSFSYLISDQITSYLIVRSILSVHLILQQSRPVPCAMHAATLDVIQPSPQLHYDVMHSTQPYGQPCAALVYSSIYSVQSSTQRLPIRALFWFTLKLVKSYLSPPSQSLCVWWFVLGVNLGSPHKYSMGRILFKHNKAVITFENNKAVAIFEQNKVVIIFEHNNGVTLFGYLDEYVANSSNQLLIVSQDTKEYKNTCALWPLRCNNSV